MSDTKEDDLIAKKHRIYFFSPNLTHQYIYHKGAWWHIWENVQVELPQKSDGMHYMSTLQRGYPQNETHWQIRWTDITVKWRKGETNGGLSLYFHVNPTPHPKFDRSNKQKRHTMATNKLKFEDSALYYKCDQFDGVEMYHFNEEIYEKRKDILNGELYKNTNSKVWKYAQQSRSNRPLRNSVGQVLEYQPTARDLSNTEYEIV